MKKKDNIKKIIFGIIGFIVQSFLSLIIIISAKENYSFDLDVLDRFPLIVIIIAVILSIVLLCFKKTRICAIIGAVTIISLYYVIIPLYEKYEVQQTCNTYGEGFKAVKYTDKITVEARKKHPEEYCCAQKWYCLSPDGILIGAK